MSKKLTFEEFVKRAKKVHSLNYSYPNGYNGYGKKLEIKCESCGKVFSQLASNHLRGEGCPYCKFKKLSNLYRKSRDEFIKEAKKIHGNKYNYDNINYINDNAKIKIFCNKCKQYFYQRPRVHLRKCNCPSCQKSHQLTTEEFQLKAKKIHGNKYNYDNVVYTNNYTKIKIFCNNCKSYFYQTPVKHLSGCNCPNCDFSKSRGEESIAKYLNNNKVFYIRQKRFKNCKDKQCLPFDFYLPDYNLCIEFQGQQHYDSKWFVNRFGLDKGLALFQNQLKHDKIKEKFCKLQNINFLKIKFNKKIEKILNKTLNLKRNIKC